jgi:hypothetical protein
VNGPAFKAEARRQSGAVANGPPKKEDLALVYSLVDWGTE